MTAVWTELTPATTPAPRRRYPMAHDRNLGLTCIAAGQGSSAATQGAYVFDGSDWALDSPWPVWNIDGTDRLALDPCMAYDETRGKVVLFGGNVLTGGGTTPNMQNDTWERDGGGWSLVSPMTSPSGRFFTSIAWCQATDSLIMFGGATGTSASDRINETWSYDGDWTQLSPATSPSVRSFASNQMCAYGTGVLMFDGGTVSPIETWFFDGTDWTDLNPPNRPGNGGVLALDEPSGWPILFAGSPSQETWAFIDGNWQQIPTLADPPIRGDLGMAYDTNVAALLLFGGWRSPLTFYDDTWILEDLVEPPPPPLGYATISHVFGLGD